MKKELTSIYKMFDIAVILINYNSSQHSINSIQSIVEKTSERISYQIIIVDNCSQEEDYLKLQSFCDTSNLINLHLYRNSINSGFGGGNMFGVQHASAKYLAFVNNDTLFKNDCLSIMMHEFETKDYIGIAGAQAFNEHDNFMVSLDHFASPAREIIGRSFLEKINKKECPKRKKRYTEPLKVNFVPGSFMFLKSEDFFEIGGFDTNIFLYYEETDLCIRLKKNSKDAYLIPNAEFIHFHGASTEKSLAIKKELKISLLYIIRKHYGFLGYKSVQTFLCLKYFFSSVFKPKNWSLFFLVLSGAPLSKSLKLKQKIRKIQ